MRTSADTTGTETSRPGLRARVRRMSRSARFAVLLGLAAGATLATTALPASAATTHAFNPYLARTQAVAGTNCSVTVSTDYNVPNAWPGTATQVSCASRHTTQVYSVLESLYQGSVHYWWTPTYTYTNAFGTSPIYYDFASPAYCIGSAQWVVYSYVTVDGVYRGPFADSRVAPWIACTGS